ncbi:hypothetical protein M8J75_008775 [Diaphorina citri]|nr:hypothetical protein M8J75_008775 [Diaphorina citri]
MKEVKKKKKTRKNDKKEKKKKKEEEEKQGKKKKKTSWVFSCTLANPRFSMSAGTGNLSMQHAAHQGTRIKPHDK